MENILSNFKEKVDIIKLKKCQDEVYMKLQQEIKNLKETNTKFCGRFNMEENIMLEKLLNDLTKNNIISEKSKLVMLIKEYFTFDKLFSNVYRNIIIMEKIIEKIDELSVLDRD